MTDDADQQDNVRLKPESEDAEFEVQNNVETEEPSEGFSFGFGNANLVRLALLAGAAVLALLLLIVWLSSRGDDASRVPLCLDISAERAAEAVLAGDVDRVDVLLDQSNPLKGLTAIQMQMIDGECRRLPEGADNREGLYQLLGAVALYNEAGGGQRVDVEYLRQAVPVGLLSTSTPVPTATTEPSPTPEPSATSTATSTTTPTATVAPTQTMTPSPTGTSGASSPVASPETAIPGSPVASPVASPQAGHASPAAESPMT